MEKGLKFLTSRCFGEINGVFHVSVIRRSYTRFINIFNTTALFLLAYVKSPSSSASM